MVVGEVLSLEAQNAVQEEKKNTRKEKKEEEVEARAGLPSRLGWSPFTSHQHRLLCSPDRL